MNERITRRYFLDDCAYGLGRIALASLCGSSLSQVGFADSKTHPFTAKRPNFAPRAKNVILLFMAGGPSQLELFDYKPSLAKYEGQQVPDSVLQGNDLPFIERDAALMPSPLKFARHGQCGAELSETLPHLASVVDDIAIVRGMQTDAFNHAPAQIFAHTGHLQLGRPSIGSWMSYGLGSEAENLPAFVVLEDNGGLSGGAACFGSGFLPSVHQGVRFRSQGDPVLFAGNPQGVDRQLQRETIDLLERLNRHKFNSVGDPEIESRISAYEMAFKLQVSAPELIDVGRESRSTLEPYGVEAGKASFANNCLLARRLVERGVRFVEVVYRGWDHHSDVAGGIKTSCKVADRPIAALIQDLKQRGLLDETLVIWGGEFGRTPMAENNPALGRSRGRDHHPNAFTIWLAGGGNRVGQTVGETDDFGYHVVKDPVHVHDLHATVLHLLGMDHEQLTYRHQGRDFRLTDVAGRVVDQLVA
jgi:hypothetical protein